MNRTHVFCLLAGVCLLLLAGCQNVKASARNDSSLPLAVNEVTATPTVGPTASAAPALTATTEPTATPTAAPKGIIVALDPGHGGMDLGARHFDHNDQMDVHESTITLQLALRVGAKLKALGYGVFYTRDGDYYPSRGHLQPDENGVIPPLDDLLWRNHIINQSGADLLLSIHLNAWETDDVQLRRTTCGVETYYSTDRPFSDKSKRFADLVQANILATLPKIGDEANDRGVMQDNLPPDTRHMVILGPVSDTITEATQMPGILSEPMFITCDRAAALMVQPQVQDALAQAYVDAIVEYFKEFPPK